MTRDEARATLMRVALERIERWHGEFPPVTDRHGNPSSYGTEYGSNGERDFMRHVAGTALAALSQPEEPGKRCACGCTLPIGECIACGGEGCTPPQPEEEPGRAAAESWAESERLNDEQRYLAAARIVARAAALEEAANLMERMVVGGRAWTQEQADTAKVLFDAAAAIRSLAEAKRGSGG